MATFAALVLGVAVSAAGASQPQVDSPAAGAEASEVFVAPDRPVRPEDSSRSDSVKKTAKKFLKNELATETIEAGGAEKLYLGSTSAGDKGSTIVRFDYASDQGIPLYGGEALVEVTRGGKVRTVNSTTSNRPFPPATPTLSADAAEATAAQHVSDSENVATEQLESTEPQLVFYDPAVVRAPGALIKDVRLAWRTEVSDSAAIRYEVLVDAADGVVLLAFNQVDTAMHRKICDSHQTSDVSCHSSDSGQHVRGEGDPELGNTEADNAYEFFGQFYDMLNDWFDRDGHAGDGRMMRGSVNVYSGGSPYHNAYYNGTQVVFGAGLATDDIVGHEWTHGLVDHTSNLIYYGESGAINESLSDVFGEFLDQLNDYDKVAGLWTLGEDWNTIRSMSNPNAYYDPDTRLGSYWYTGSGDNGGVHINSGVGNKLGHLITAGGSHNGYSITGLGIEKAARVIYGANLLLTSSSDYLAYGNALNQACSTLVGSDSITTADCDEVTEATQAVNIYTDPDAPAPPEPEDAAGDTLATATELPGSWTVRELLHSGDNDYWSFTLTAASDVTIVLDELPTDYDLELYDASGSRIAYSWRAYSYPETINRSLEPGTYIARVHPWSTPTTDTYRLTVTCTPCVSVPAAPVLDGAVAGDGSALLSWTAGSDGGSAVTDFEYQLDGSGSWVSLGTTGTGASLTGLTNGQTYSVQIRMLNAIGPGAASNSLEVTPHTGPAAEVTVKAVAKRTRIKVDVDPDNMDGQWRLVVQKQTQRGWKTVRKVKVVRGQKTRWRRTARLTTRGSKHKVLLDLGKGTYRIKVKPGYDHAGTQSAPVTLRR